jgi:hypothetical protein
MIVADAGAAKLAAQPLAYKAIVRDCYNHFVKVNAAQATD